MLQPLYLIPDPLPWDQLASPLTTAEDALARLDERLAKSPIRDGWIARTHFTDACASLWLEGELVHLEDLVLHDAHMDVRAPTHELTRARAVLQTRRRIAAAKPDWALSTAGVASLCGRGGNGDREEAIDIEGREPGSGQDESADIEVISFVGASEADERLAATFAAVDAAITNADRTLARETRNPHLTRLDSDPLVYDLDWDEGARFNEWRAIVEACRSRPPTLAAAIALDAWGAIQPLQHMPWLGQLLAAALLRDRGKAQCHLPCLHNGLKAIPRERRRPRDAAGRLAVQLEAIAAAARAGLKDHDRWLTARTLLVRKLAGRRSTSRLPALLDYVLTRPIVSTAMIAQELGVTPRAAQNLVAELGLREATGRGTYRAWGIL
nr:MULTISPECIES: RHE_PE00001 family protein [unclassified Bradyrhizobium]